MKKLMLGFMKDESGAPLIEYAFLVALIAIAAYVGIQGLGTDISEMFTNIGTSLTNLPTTG